MGPNNIEKKFSELTVEEKIEVLRLELLDIRYLITSVSNIEQKLLELYEHKHDKHTGDVCVKAKYYTNNGTALGSRIDRLK